MERFALAAAVVLGFVMWGAVSTFGVPNAAALLPQQPAARQERFGTKSSSRYSLSSPGLHPCAPRCGAGCVLRRARWLRWAWAGLPPA